MIEGTLSGGFKQPVAVLAATRANAAMGLVPVMMEAAIQDAPCTMEETQAVTLRVLLLWCWNVRGQKKREQKLEGRGMNRGGNVPSGPGSVAFCYERLMPTVDCSSINCKQMSQAGERGRWPKEKKTKRKRVLLLLLLPVGFDGPLGARIATHGLQHLDLALVCLFCLARKAPTFFSMLHFHVPSFPVGFPSTALYNIVMTLGKCHVVFFVGYASCDYFLPVLPSLAIHIHLEIHSSAILSSKEKSIESESKNRSFDMLME